jgi:TfoX/Sxy family transcriptional regulator of competence genes
MRDKKPSGFLCYPKRVMATSKEFMEYIVDQVGRGSGIENISVRKMFGEYALYYLGVTVGLICDDTLFVKIIPETEKILGSHATGLPYPGAKPWYQLDESDLDNYELMEVLINVIYEQGVLKKSKKKK